MIDSFSDEYRWLSNFHYVHIEYEGLFYPTTENAYQAVKSNDVAIRKVFTGITPGQAKKLGGQINLREDWDKVKFKVMEEINTIKFSNTPLNLWLLETDNKKLVEGNHWGDTYWGVCKGVGENNLGKILMKIRMKIRGNLKVTNNSRR